MAHVSVLLRQATFIRSFSILGQLLLHVLHDEVNDLHIGCEEMLLGHDTPIKGESHGPAVGNLPSMRPHQTKEVRLKISSCSSSGVTNKNGIHPGSHLLIYRSINCVI